MSRARRGSFGRFVSASCRSVALCALIGAIGMPAEGSEKPDAASLHAIEFTGDEALPALGGPPTDCNENGIADSDDVSGATSDDCNVNGIPDECEAWDCNSNGIADCVEILADPSRDQLGTIFPCWGRDGVLDECQLESNDCNGNDRPDECDISGGTSLDANTDGFPDECGSQPGLQDCLPADVNCDGFITGQDIATVRNPSNFNLPTGSAADPRADVNGDGFVSGVDIGAIRNPTRFNTGAGTPCNCVTE